MIFIHNYDVYDYEDDRWKVAKVKGLWNKLRP